MIDRRSFLAASAATLVTPVLGGSASAALPGTVDVAIIGAGAAGIAAARRVAAANRRFVVLEASARIGGRCFTDTTTFDVPFDRGARAIYAPDVSPVAMAATKANIDIYPAPPGQKIRIGRRNAREGEMEDFLATLVRANRAIGDAGRGKADAAASQALPKDLGDWKSAVEFVLGPFATGKDLAEISAYDLSKLTDRDAPAFCRLGYGGLLGKLAGPVELSTPVTRIDWSGRSGVEIETAKGRLTARAVIITASTNVLATGKIAFTPALPKRQLDAISKLSLGSYDRIALELPGNPLGLQRDDLVLDKSSDIRTAALLANAGGSNLCVLDVAGKFGRDLAGRGEAAMLAFAGDWLVNLFGSDIAKSIKRGAATRWNEDPWTLGAMSVAAPGAQLSRKALMEPLNNRLWFAGEAAHETWWGTVNGAWDSGERAATDALKKIGVITEPAPVRRPPPKRAAVDR